MKNIFGDTDLKILFSTLTILTIISDIGYYLLGKNEVISLFYLALLYMPIPLYSLAILSIIKKENFIKKYWVFRSIKFKDILFTLSIFFIWTSVLAILTFTLSTISPSVFGELMKETSQLVNYLKDMVSPEELADLNNLSSPLLLFPLGVFGAIIAGFTINGLFGFTEEVLWRGYLYDKFSDYSLHARNLIIGTVWGLWHIPLIIQGYNYGNNINPIIGSFAFIIVCISLTYLLNLLRSKTNSVILCGVFHGAFNGLAGIFTLLLLNYNPLISGQIGIVSVISIFITYLLFKEKNILCN